MSNTTNTSAPSTDEEYAIQALTIHGVFFERKCQEIVQQMPDWNVREANYPVEHKGVASNLDIWAERKYNVGSNLLLPIECKKNNPEFVDWIFFPRAKETTPDLHIQTIEVRKQSGLSWAIRRQELRIKYDVAFADEARETKGNYLAIKNSQNRTKTSNAAITDAAAQIAIATQSLLEQECRIMTQLADYHAQNNQQYMPHYYNLLCFPTIVTTANLYTCTFQEADIDLTTGEIPFDKAKLDSCLYLIYNYPMPVALQSPPIYEGMDYQRHWDAMKRVARMPIFIVQSGSLPTFLQRLQMPEEHRGMFDDERWFSMQLEPGKIGQSKRG